MVIIGGMSMSSSSGISNLGTSEEKINYILEHVKIPETRELMSAQDWETYEQSNKIKLPEDYKKILDLYGCGEFARVDEVDSQLFYPSINVRSPNCSNGSRTWHESLLLYWEQDMDERKYDSNFDMPLLFPEPNAVYAWGYWATGIQFAFPYQTDELGWKVVDPSVTFEIDRVTWLKNNSGFIDIIYEFVFEAMNPPEGTKITRLEFKR